MHIKPTIMSLDLLKTHSQFPRALREFREKISYSFENVFQGIIREYFKALQNWGPHRSGPCGRVASP